MLNRRELFKLSILATAASFVPYSWARATASRQGPFRFCLNTSTIRGQRLGLLSNIDIAAKARYDGVELWVSDVQEYLNQGNSVESLAAFIKAKGIAVEDAISFTTWMVDDDAKRKQGLKELGEEMKLMAALGCKRIAAPPAGVDRNGSIDFQKAGARYREALVLGRKYKVMPLLEFWGASGTLYNLGQSLAIAAAADDAEARILPDVFHLFRGGSGFNGLKLVNGKVIDIIHMNDYPASKPVEQQTDSDRVYPGDGVAPIKQILRDLMAMGGTKILSLELFNETYWKQDAFQVAQTGLQKMKLLVSEVVAGK
ncbi:MAG TPA: sugar phosphate isomerase/epimerase family protein [Puia sp.]|jgi:2-keto-myo-inositol isomerase|nr:sugar phosphate isomerase/epimerase family protein [Puia sp.]